VATYETYTIAIDCVPYVCLPDGIDLGASDATKEKTNEEDDVNANFVRTTNLLIGLVVSRTGLAGGCGRIVERFVVDGRTTIGACRLDDRLNFLLCNGTRSF
jgi:hypothetical protein